MSVNFGLKLSEIEETARTGIEAPPSSPVSDFERFGAVVAELPTVWHYPYVPYEEAEPESRVVDHATSDGARAFNVGNCPRIPRGTSADLSRGTLQVPERLRHPANLGAALF